MLPNIKMNTVGVLVIFALIITIATTSYFALKEYYQNTQWVNHTNEVIEALQDFEVNFFAAESEARAFLISTAQVHFYNFRLYVMKARQIIDSIQVLTADNKVQQSNIKSLQTYVNDKLANLKFKIDYRRFHSIDSFMIGSTLSGSNLTHQAEVMALKMRDEELRLLKIRTGRVSKNSSIANVIIIAGSLINLLIVALLIVSIKRAFVMKDMAEMQLLQSNHQLTELNKQKNYLLGVAAHDLRNPVANITTICDLLFPEIQKKISREDFDLLNDIQISSSYISQLLTDLLDVAQIESGKLTLNNSTVEINRYIEKIWKLNKIAAEKKNHKLILENSLETSLNIAIDAVKIEQVLNNLISNAIKFSPSGSFIYLILIQSRNAVVIKVKDHGPGIPLTEQHKLFKAFQMTSVKATNGEKSTGLGLMICKNIVKAHGGVLSVKSEPGKGSEFYFNLPIVQLINHAENV